MKGKYLAIVVIILLISFNVTGSFIRNKEVKNISTISYDGNILYVGGSGPNNYTKIQDAVNDSYDGDTIFVYNGIYYEQNITIDKSIDLLGEYKETTIIQGNNNFSILIVDSNWTNISGFTIKNGEDGIVLVSGNVIISDNNISSNIDGISNFGILNDNKNLHAIIRGNNFWNNSLLGVIAFGFDGSIFKLSENLFENNYGGIGVMVVCNSLFLNNVFKNNNESIIVLESINCTFKNNYISNSSLGLYSMFFYNSNIISNSFIDNDEGLIIFGSGNRITQNNFIRTNITAIFERQIFFELLIRSNFIKLFNNSEPYRILSKNIWDGNYWNEPRTTPYLIRGKFHLMSFPRIPFPFFNLDWHPASEPYDIEVTL